MDVAFISRHSFNLLCHIDTGGFIKNADNSDLIHREIMRIWMYDSIYMKKLKMECTAWI